MKLASLRQFVDADLPLTDAQVAELWRNTHRKRRLPPKEAILFFSTYFGPPLLLLAGAAIFIDATGYPKTTTLIVGLLMCGWFCVAIALIVRRPWYVIPFRRELRRRGHHICIRCGYWLRGLNKDSTRCPECGKAIRIHVTQTPRAQTR